jgi:hypothetical protein
LFLKEAKVSLLTGKTFTAKNARAKKMSQERKVIDVMTSLARAAASAGVAMDEELMEMSLRDFVVDIAAPNGIAFKTDDEDFLMELAKMGKLKKKKVAKKRR